MRDDIHNRVPVSKAMRAVLQSCMREADRKQPEHVVAKAVVALAKDLKANIDSSVMTKLAGEVAKPSLFGCEGISAAPRSALQTEALSLLARGETSNVGKALEASVISHITSVISETNATLVAEGVSRSERATVIQALRSALSDAAGPAVAEYLGESAPVPKFKIGLDDKVVLGARAAQRSK